MANIRHNKKIGGYICTKAIARFRGRNYIAWFTPQIPLPYGPWKLIGLPGLILKVYTADRKIFFSAQKLKIYDANKYPHLHLLSNGKEKVINLKQYKKLLVHRKKQKKQLKRKTTKKIHKMMRVLRQNNLKNKSYTKISISLSRRMEIFSDSTKH